MPLHQKTAHKRGKRNPQPLRTGALFIRDVAGGLFLAGTHKDTGFLVRKTALFVARKIAGKDSQRRVKHFFLEMSLRDKSKQTAWDGILGAGINYAFATGLIALSKTTFGLVKPMMDDPRLVAGAVKLANGLAAFGEGVYGLWLQFSAPYMVAACALTLVGKEAYRTAKDAWQSYRRWQDLKEEPQARAEKPYLSFASTLEAKPEIAPSDVKKAQAKNHLSPQEKQKTPKLIP